MLHIQRYATGRMGIFSEIALCVNASVEFHLSTYRHDLFGYAPCKGGAFPVGASPTRQNAPAGRTGATMEVTKWLKPSGMVKLFRHRQTKETVNIER
jgi:hypothetical protein